MSGQAVRGGRLALDRLLDDLAVVQDLAAEGRAAIFRNPGLAQDRLDDIGDAVRDLRRYIVDTVQPLLKRRDGAGAAAEQAIHERLTRLEERMARLEAERNREQP